MSVKRYAARRDANEARIVAVLREVGATVQPLSIKGVPDLLVGFRGVNFLLEVKTRKGTTTEDQDDFRDVWQGQYIIARTEHEALQAIGAID